MNFLSCAMLFLRKKAKSAFPDRTKRISETIRAEIMILEKECSRCGYERTITINQLHDIADRLLEK